MNNLKYFFLIGLACFFIAGCKKPSTQTVNTVNSTDTLSYQPNVAGSVWKYTRTVFGVNTNYNFTRLATDTILYGNTYNVYNSDADGMQYIRKDGGKYYNILTASTNKPALLVLDTAMAVGSSWVGGTNGNDTYTYTMKQKIPVYTQDGFTFKNVLVVHAERTTAGSSTLSTDTYYAQGIGQVKTTGTVSGASVLVTLISVTLK